MSKRESSDTFDLKLFLGWDWAVTEIVKHLERSDVVRLKKTCHFFNMRFDFTQKNLHHLIIEIWEDLELFFIYRSSRAKPKNLLSIIIKNVNIKSKCLGRKKCYCTKGGDGRGEYSSCGYFVCKSCKDTNNGLVDFLHLWSESFIFDMLINNAIEDIKLICDFIATNNARIKSDSSIVWTDEEVKNSTKWKVFDRRKILDDDIPCEKWNEYKHAEYWKEYGDKPKIYHRFIDQRILKINLEFVFTQILDHSSYTQTDIIQIIEKCTRANNGINGETLIKMIDKCKHPNYELILDYLSKNFHDPLA